MSKLLVRIASVSLLVMFALLPFGAFAQKPNKFEDALERSKDAGRIVSLLALMPDGDLPKELVDKAQAMGRVSQGKAGDSSLHSSV
jgi:hypothetical protein